ncbi:MAG: hypothetical protein ACXW2U_10110 [Telluria sp.]
MSAPLTADDHLVEVTARAIGPNDPYPNQAQLDAHRTKQDLKEKQFPCIESKEVPQ